MGAMRRLLGAGIAVLAVGGVVACEPGGMSSASVAYTTDETVTREMQRRDTEVRWLTCTADYGDSGRSASATEETVASVDCEGETKDGKKITVDGKVTRIVDGACVRGELTAKVDGRQWFRVNGLGDCDATPTPPGNGPGGNAPRPTVTVTVTKTVWCQERPGCWPEGK
ncbi:hypothetical protein ACLGIH_23150 [Streptomyces sp. HMX87]|uniref:hypothetical protein n=1 Tax=Streptomyces sp. HMX87 TaxID=3390849 RepID=UPI003A8874E6